jgi:o-succinylbenzoate synthase
VAPVPRAEQARPRLTPVSALFPSGRLRSIELIRVCVPLVTPLETAHGVEHDRWSILVKVTGVDGTAGWGECPALAAPTYTAEWHEGAWAVLLNHLAPAALSGRPAGVRGHPMAVSALEGALVDLELRRRGVSLAEAIGAERASVPACAVVGIAPSIDELLTRVETAGRQGYQAVKLKIRPGWDIEPLSAVRSSWPALPLAADANGSFERLDALDTLARLDELGLLYLEQPLAVDDLIGSAELVSTLATPIALDEGAASLGTIESALALGAVEAVNLKPARLGGLVACVDIHALLHERGVSMWGGGMLELGVGRAGALAVAALPGCVLPTDLGPSDRYVDRDVVEPFVLDSNGALAVPTGPGIGRVPDPDRLDEVAVARRIIGG